MIHYTDAEIRAGNRRVRIAAEIEANTALVCAKAHELIAFIEALPGDIATDYGYRDDVIAALRDMARLSKPGVAWLAEEAVEAEGV